MPDEPSPMQVDLFKRLRREMVGMTTYLLDADAEAARRIDEATRESEDAILHGAEVLRTSDLRLLFVATLRLLLEELE